MPEFRIEYSIQQAANEDEKFVEIGFGSSGSWSTVNSALYAVDSQVQNRQWETEPGMPDPDEVDTHA
jgi:hypothetical protein